MEITNMCIYQQEVDALNKEYGWEYFSPARNLCNDSPSWTSDGGETLVSIEKGLWYLWDQGTEITTTNNSLKEGLEFHQMERKLEECIHNAGLKSKISMYYY
jgi:hypothetical protein